MNEKFYVSFKFPCTTAKGEQAKSLAPEVKSWVDFSMALFDQHEGIVAKVFPNPMERQAFFDTEQHQQINRIQLDLMKKFGVEGGGVPSKSGRFVVRVPKTVHTRLDIEAKPILEQAGGTSRITDPPCYLAKPLVARGRSAYPGMHP